MVSRLSIKVVSETPNADSISDSEEIVKLGLVPIPSVANFILVKFPNKGKFSANKVIKQGETDDTH